MAAFADGPASAGVREICGEHSHVTVAAPRRRKHGASGRARRRPQPQPSRDLAAEIARRKQVETALRSSVHELSAPRPPNASGPRAPSSWPTSCARRIHVNELFIGVLAHDLRAPLAAIMTAAELIKKREAARADAATRRRWGA